MIKKNKRYKLTRFAFRVRLLSYIAFFLILSTGAIAQQTVRGTVTDDKDVTFPGATVNIKGTKTSVTTDLKGNFSITVPSQSNMLVISYIGYETKEIEVGNQRIINVQIKPTSTSLSDVVVIGYGSQKKSDLTGAISSVSAKDIEKSTPLNAVDALQGRASGVTVTSNSGAPGSLGTIRIRGIGTVNNNDPLFVVDGTFVSDIGYLNPTDISSIEVLKDASAAAIYGSRGANGVILVTTKKGAKDMAPIVTLNASATISELSNIAKTIDRDQSLEYMGTAYMNGYLRSVPGADPNVDPFTTSIAFFAPVKSAKSQYDLGYNTDWQKLLFHTALIQNYDISIRGGTSTARYAVGGGYFDQKGILDNSGLKKYAFRLNSDYTIKKRLILGQNLGLTVSNLAGGGGFVDGRPNSVIAQILSTPRTFPEINPNANPNDPNYEYNKYGTDHSGSTNPAGLIARINDVSRMLKIVGNVYAEVEIIKGLKAKTSFAYDYNTADSTAFNPAYFISGSDQSPVSTVAQTNTSFLGQIWENTLNYNTTISKHSISALLGYTEELYAGKFTNGTRQGTANNDPSSQVLNAATGNITLIGNKVQNSLQSYFGRINYAFDDRYLLTGTLRRDGSSKFASDRRWGTFPSASVGWRLSNEQFFQQLDAKVISSIKIRAGWGEIGNQSIPGSNNNPNLSLISGMNNYRYVFGNAISSGNYLSSLGTPSISWETSEQTNIGTDISLFDNSLSITADYFIKNTKDVLLQVPLPSYSGFPGIPFTNAGSIRNKGYEIVISYRGKLGKLGYDIGANASHFDNKVVSLGTGDKPIVSLDPSTSLSANKTAVGHTVGELFGYVTDGIFQNTAEVQAYKNNNGTLLQPRALPGDFRFKDTNGDGVIDANDQTYIGNPLPKMTYGLNINLQYGGFDLTAFFQGSYGNKLFNVNKKYSSTLNGATNPLVTAYQAAWRGEGTSNSQPIISTVNNNDNFRVSDWYVEDGSYFRLKNLQIGYRISNGLSKRYGISNFRIWIGGTDLFTVTKYTGNDPEAGLSASPLFAGREFSAYPKIKRYSFGINASF